MANQTRGASGYAQSQFSTRGLDNRQPRAFGDVADLSPSGLCSVTYSCVNCSLELSLDVPATGRCAEPRHGAGNGPQRPEASRRDPQP